MVKKIYQAIAHGSICYIFSSYAEEDFNVKSWMRKVYIDGRQIDGFQKDDRRNEMSISYITVYVR